MKNQYFKIKNDERQSRKKTKLDTKIYRKKI